MLDFEIAPKITKDLLLSKFSEETIFCHYLGINSISKKLVRNTTRDDRNPTCGFYRNSRGTLILHDFATGEYFNCFSYVMKAYHCEFHKALEIIASDFGILKQKNNIPKKIRHIPKFEDENKITHIQIEMTKFNEQDLKWWGSFGISEKTLKKFRVFSCKSVFLNGNLISQRAQHNPIYGYYFGKKNGIEQWRIYFPQRKEMRFMGNVPTKTVQGYKQLPKSGKLLVITKSMKDVLLLHELGIPAIAPNSETQNVSDKMFEELKSRFKYIVYVFDNDLPGISNMVKFKKHNPEAIYHWIPRAYNAKDITDFYKKYGKLETIKFIKLEIDKIKNGRKTKFIK